MSWQKMRKISEPDKVDIDRDTVKTHYKQLKKVMSKNGIKLKMADVRRSLELQNKEAVYINDLYECRVDYDMDIPHLSIKNHEKTTEISWQHKQWIKNDIVGEEMEACELFPAESRLVNTANQFHLWCFPKGVMKFGWNARIVDDAELITDQGTSKQDLQTRE
tara:strand:- start:1449 stop:1937 length:489 start_codon:yes stop_codon:yes gene_type:complete